MPFVKSPLSRGLLLLASISLVLTGVLRAQSPSDQIADSSLEVTIRSASGQERRPLHHAGLVDRVGLRPGQTVNVTLKFPGKSTGESVAIGTMDGGTLTGQQDLATSAAGLVQFTYQAGSIPGRYRVPVQIVGQEYWLEFYVLDTATPSNNPPRVRIVD